MVSKTFFESKKIANATAENLMNGYLYLALLLHTDVLGRFEADPLSIKGCLGRWGRQILQSEPALHEDWTEDGLADLEREGLIRLWSVDGERYGEIVDFQRHNTTRADREGTSRIPNPPGATPGVTPGPTPGPAPGATPAPLRGGMSAEVQEEVQVQVQEEEEDEDEEDRSSSSRPSPKEDKRQPVPELPIDGRTGGEINRILRCWKGVYDQVNAERAELAMPPMIAPRSSFHEAGQACEASVYFKTEELLTRELRRVARIQDRRGIPVTFRGTCKLIGQVFEDMGDDAEPVIWEKRVPDGPPCELAREIARALPEMPQ